MVTWDLNERQIADLELLLNGAFSPLEAYNREFEYQGIIEHMRLPGGVLWPIPVVLDVTEAFAENLSEGQDIALRDPEGVLVATLRAESIWSPDKAAEAGALYGTQSEAHPGVRRLLRSVNTVYVGGPVQGVEPPTHYDFKLLRDSPSELRGRFRKLGWRRVVAYQPRGAMHQAEQNLGFDAARRCEANLLIQPTVGPATTGEMDHFTRVRCYEHVLGAYPELTTTLSI